MDLTNRFCKKFLDWGGNHSLGQGVWSSVSGGETGYWAMSPP